MNKKKKKLEEGNGRKNKKNKKRIKPYADKTSVATYW